jgi:hypothetical protein
MRSSRSIQSIHLCPPWLGRTRNSGVTRTAAVVGGLPERESEELNNRNVGRVVSLPSQSDVQEARQREREQGGPRAPPNSLDVSVVVLEDSPEDRLVSLFEEVFEEDPSEISSTTPSLQNIVTARSRSTDDVISMSNSRPLTPMPFSRLSEGPDVNPILAISTPPREGLDVTIDLTYSPDISPDNTGEDIASPPATIKCPICFDSLRAIRAKAALCPQSVATYSAPDVCLPVS